VHALKQAVTASSEARRSGGPEPEPVDETQFPHDGHRRSLCWVLPQV